MHNSLNKVARLLLAATSALHVSCIHGFAPQIVVTPTLRHNYAPHNHICSPSHGHLCQARGRHRKLVITNLRNFDLPEALIFYGLRTILAPSPPSSDQKGSNGVEQMQPGVKRLINEAHEADTACILLSETHETKDLRERLLGTGLPLSTIDDKGAGAAKHLHICSSKELPLPRAETNDNDSANDHYDEEYEEDMAWEYTSKLSRTDVLGLGYGPSPAALLDAMRSLQIAPRGFGGSSGFGTKAADPPRPPIPKHCVVFIPGESPQSRLRCAAARAAGMRVMFLEGDTTCDAEDLVDGVVYNLGGEDDWEVVTLDDVATPGSFWLNPPHPRDDDGNKILPAEVIQYYYEERIAQAVPNTGFSEEDAGGNKKVQKQEEEEHVMGEDEMAKILADLDHL